MRDPAPARNKVKRKRKHVEHSTGSNFFGCFSKNKKSKTKRRGTDNNEAVRRSRTLFWLIFILGLIVAIVVGSTVQFLKCEPGFRTVRSLSIMIIFNKLDVIF